MLTSGQVFASPPQPQRCILDMNRYHVAGIWKFNAFAFCCCGSLNKLTASKVSQTAKTCSDGNECGGLVNGIKFCTVYILSGTCLFRFSPLWLSTYVHEPCRALSHQANHQHAKNAQSLDFLSSLSAASENAGDFAFSMDALYVVI